MAFCFVLLLFCLVHLSEPFHLLPDAIEQSKRMMMSMMKEINSWNFTGYLYEMDALYGIKRLMQINSSQPIKEGISLVYFIQKRNNSECSTFGSKQVAWTCHCCIGFKDAFVAKDWFIDSFYHRMANCSRLKRMIPEKEYLTNIPCTVDAFVIPLCNLEHFVNNIQLNSTRMNLDEFLDFRKRHIRTLMWIFDPISRDKSNSLIIESMIIKNIVLKAKTPNKFNLPFGKWIIS